MIQLEILGSAAYPQAYEDQCTELSSNPALSPPEDVDVGFYKGHLCSPVLLVELSDGRGMKIYGSTDEHKVALGELLASRVDQER